MKKTRIQPATRAKRGEARRWLLAHKDYTGDDCLIWPFCRNTTGYGKISVGGRPEQVNRVMCEMAHGRPPSPCYDAAHSCGNSSCANPRHLRWATRRENSADKILHGTHIAGEKSPLTKLTDREATAIIVLRGRLPQKEIARLFDVSLSVVSSIQTGRGWRHL